jgi:hypothetical protein
MTGGYGPAGQMAAIGAMTLTAAMAPTPAAASQADVQRTDQAIISSYQDQAKAALQLADAYDKVGAKRRELEGSAKQLKAGLDAMDATAALGGGKDAEQYQRIAAGLAAVNDELGKLNQQKDGLEAYLRASERMKVAAAESVYGTQSRTQAEVALTQIEELYRDGQIKGTEATMERIRANLQAAAASERLAFDRQRELQLEAQYLQALEQKQTAGDAAMQAFATNSTRRVQGIELETQLITQQTDRERAAFSVTATRDQQIQTETRVQAENNAEREKAIEFRRIDAEAQQASINRTEQEIAQIYRTAAAKKDEAAASIDARAAAQQAQAAASATRQAWQAEQQRLADTTQSTLTHALVTAFTEGGRSGADALKAALKASFATLVLEPMIRPIMMPVAQAGAAMSQAMFGPGGGMTSIPGFGGGFGGFPDASSFFNFGSSGGSTSRPRTSAASRPPAARLVSAAWRAAWAICRGSPRHSRRRRASTARRRRGPRGRVCGLDDHAGHRHGGRLHRGLAARRQPVRRRRRRHR